MDNGSDQETGLFSSLTQAASTLRETVENRIELFLVELKEDRARLFNALCLSIIAVVLAMMAMIVATFTIVVAFWDTHRLLVLVVLTVVYAAASAATFTVLRSRLKNWKAFNATVEEFQKDKECFKRQN